MKRERALGRVEALEARIEDDAARRTGLEREVQRLLDTEEAQRTEARVQTARLTTEVEARTRAEDARARADAALDAAEARLESEAAATAARIKALERTIGEGNTQIAALEARVSEASTENEAARAALARVGKLESRVDALVERLAANETDRTTLAAIAAALARRDGDADDSAPAADD